VVFAVPPKSTSKRARESEDEREHGKKTKKNGSSTKNGLVSNTVGRKASFASMEAPVRSPKVVKQVQPELPKTKQNISRAATQMIRFPEDLEHSEASPARVITSASSKKGLGRESRYMYEEDGSEELQLVAVRTEDAPAHRDQDQEEIDPLSEDVAQQQDDYAPHSDVVDHDPDQTAVELEQEHEDEGVFVGQQIPIHRAIKDAEVHVPEKEVAQMVLHPECQCTNCFYDPRKATKYDTQVNLALISERRIK